MLIIIRSFNQNLMLEKMRYQFSPQKGLIPGEDTCHIC